MADSKQNSQVGKGLNVHVRRAIAYTVLILISFFCLFWFYVLFINATRSLAELGKPCERDDPGLGRVIQQPDCIDIQRDFMRIFFYHDGICDPCV